MSENSKIEWTHHTFNPWWGCTKVSPACDHCYAESLAKRYGHAIWGRDAGRRFFGEAHFNELPKWNRAAEKAGERQRVFCGSMCDLMEEYSGPIHLVPEAMDESRLWLYNWVPRTLFLDYLFLTKRPQNYSRLLPRDWVLRGLPRNLWLGTTVENRAALWRADKLREMYGAAVRFLSVEPLLEDVGEINLEGIDWVIVGGESGPGSRPMHPSWVRSIRDRCVSSGVKFFFKQWGEWAPISRTDGVQELPFGDYSTVADRHLLIPYSGFARAGKKKSGRVLDGRTWDEFPEVRA